MHAKLGSIGKGRLVEKKLTQVTHAQQPHVHVDSRKLDRNALKSGVVDNSKSYASILKRDQPTPKQVVSKEPMSKNKNARIDEVIHILPDEHIPISDSATIVLGKVKDLTLIEKLSALIMKEGF
ncbi:hypothetical protein LXL04_032431 [Taraxacum kok-saghyz]